MMEQVVANALKNYHYAKYSATIAPEVPENRAVIELLEKIDRAITALPDMEGQVIDCLYHHRMSWNATANRLYISPNTLNRNRKSGIKHIAEMLDGTYVQGLMARLSELGGNTNDNQ